MILDILIEASKNVFKEVKDLIGTNEGNTMIGIGAGGDISRNIDIVAERAVFDTIKSHNFSPTIIGEECGIVNPNNNNNNVGSNDGYNRQGFLIMDAVDGTTNATRSIPFFCCSLAYASEFKLSSVVDAVVLDLVTGDIYSATKENGSFLNNQKINVRNTDLTPYHSLTDLRSLDLVIGTNVSGVPSEVLTEISKIISFSSHIRHFGANALELCYFARGFMDAYIDIRGKIRTTDMAAGYLIAKEAGGKLLSLDGHELDSDLDNRTILSFYALTNEKLFSLLKNSL